MKFNDEFIDACKNYGVIQIPYPPYKRQLTFNLDYIFLDEFTVTEDVLLDIIIYNKANNFYLWSILKQYHPEYLI